MAGETDRVFYFAVMKVLENQKVYVCDHCGRKSVSAGGMNRHELACSFNPDNYNVCPGCKYLLAYTDFVYYEHDPDHERKVKKFKCTKKNEIMYPSKIKRNRIIDKYPDNFEGEVQMPKICDSFDGSTTYDL